MTWLLDGSVLVALAISTHVHHERARLWFDALTDPFATCAVTEGTLLRLHMKFAANTAVDAAWEVIAAIHAMPDHEFWDDGFSYREVKHNTIEGPSQVTDAWLTALARRRGGKLVTMDTALVAMQMDIAVLIATPPVVT